MQPGDSVDQSLVREGEEAELGALLAAEPDSVRAHVLMGDFRARSGEEDLARYFYRAALRLAEGRRLPHYEADDARRAERRLAEIESGAHARREALLAERGLPPDSWSPRFRHFLDLAAGKRKLYAPQPTAFTYPELAARQFYDPAEFGWAAAVEAAAPAIREELLALLGEGTDRFRAYIQGSTVAGEANRELLGKKDWSILPLCENGWLSPDVVERCPGTWETVLQAPLPRISGWGPTVVFSLLKAGAHIAAHTGMINTRLICHLPLIVPPGCRFRVGDEVREWEEGKLLIFDDTIEHEAWNDSAEDRVVLIFDVWRPELSEREKYELTALFSD